MKLLEKLAELADLLDSKGFTLEANQIDKVIKNAVAWEPYDAEKSRAYVEGRIAFRLDQLKKEFIDRLINIPIEGSLIFGRGVDTDKLNKLKDYLIELGNSKLPLSTVIEHARKYLLVDFDQTANGREQANKLLQQALSDIGRGGFDKEMAIINEYRKDPMNNHL